MSKELIATKAIKTLAALGYAYVIRTDTGEILRHGEITERKRRAPNPEYADYSAHLASVGLHDLAVGGVLTVDCTGRSLPVLRSRASAYASKAWGNGNYTMQSGENDFSILRIG